MKLSPRTFVAEWQLHAWASVVASILLFVVCFTGLYALVFDDLLLWEDPRLTESAAAYGGDARAVNYDRLLPALEQHARVPHGSRVRLHFFEQTRYVGALIQQPGSTAHERRWIDPESGRVLDPRSRLAFELFFLHFLYRLPGGLQLTGLLGVVLLVSLLSGTLIQLKDLWRQRWRLRSAPTRARASDLHKVLGVFGLPFTVVMAWSGAFLGLGTLLGGALAWSNYHGDRAHALALHGMSQPKRTATAASDEPLSLGALIAAARAIGPDVPPESVDVRLYRDRQAWVQLTFPASSFEPKPQIQLDGHSHAVLAAGAHVRSPSRRFTQVLFDLHFAHFGGYLLQLAYGVLALALCAVIVTGNLVWLERRDPERATRASYLLERLTIGVCTGLVLACALFLLANRVLPTRLGGRVELETGVFYGAWLLASLAAFVPSVQARSFARIVLLTASALFASVLAVDLAAADGRLGHVLAVELSIALQSLASALAGRMLARTGRTVRSVADGSHSSYPQPEVMTHANTTTNELLP